MKPKTDVADFSGTGHLEFTGNQPEPGAALLPRLPHPLFFEGMTAEPPVAPISIEKYLAGEEIAETKHEYIGGAIHAMAGGTRDHSAIAANAIGTWHGQLRGKSCRPFTSDLKIRIDCPDHTRFYYPDVSVVCTPESGDPRYERIPVVLLEVLSESTRRVDQTERREGYFHIPSLQILILADSERVHAVVYRRRPDGGFGAEEYTGLHSTIPLPEIEASLTLAELYEGVRFENQAET